MKQFHILIKICHIRILFEYDERENIFQSLITQKSLKNKIKSIVCLIRVFEGKIVHSFAWFILVSLYSVHKFILKYFILF